MKSTETKNGLKETIDVKGYAKGTYFIKVQAGNTTYREKVIIW